MPLTEFAHYIIFRHFLRAVRCPLTLRKKRHLIINWRAKLFFYTFLKLMGDWCIPPSLTLFLKTFSFLNKIKLGCRIRPLPPIFSLLMRLLTSWQTCKHFSKVGGVDGESNICLAAGRFTRPAGTSPVLQVQVPLGVVVYKVQLRYCWQGSKGIRQCQWIDSHPQWWSTKLLYCRFRQLLANFDTANLITM